MFKQHEKKNHVKITLCYKVAASCDRECPWVHLLTVGRRGRGHPQVAPAVTYTWLTHTCLMDWPWAARVPTSLVLLPFNKSLTFLYISSLLYCSPISCLLLFSGPLLFLICINDVGSWRRYTARTGVVLHLRRWRRYRYRYSNHKSKLNTTL